MGCHRLARNPQAGRVADCRELDRKSPPSMVPLANNNRIELKTHTISHLSRISKGVRNQLAVQETLPLREKVLHQNR